MREIWKDIVGYEGLYLVSNLGRVKRAQRLTIRRDGRPLALPENLLTGFVNSLGYRKFTLSKGSKTLSFSGHRLVALAFIPNPTGLDQVNHINGVKADNRLENLEWSNNSENQLHAYRLGLNWSNGPKGERCHLCKISTATAKAILYDISQRVRNKDICKKYGVKQSHVSSIKKGRIWAHLMNG